MTLLRSSGFAQRHRRLAGLALAVHLIGAPAMATDSSHAKPVNPGFLRAFPPGWWLG